VVAAGSAAWPWIVKREAELKSKGGLHGLKANPSAGADDQNCRHARQCSCQTRHSSSCVMCGLGNRTARWARGLTMPADSLTSPRSSDVGGAPRHVAFVPPTRLF
jgi:hypothetical protein